MIEDYIRYDQLIDNAMRQVVKDALLKVKKEGLSGDHHFLISFFTSFEGVSIPIHLKEKYPEEMTIVLQHQYEDLEVTEEYMKVNLSFESKREEIKIPFAALTSFADPGVRFGLKFNILADEALLEELAEEIEEEASKAPKKAPKKTTAKKKGGKKDADKKSKNVVELSTFRKK